MTTKKSILFSILSGFLISTSYIPFPPWALFFCFIPLWYVQNLQTRMSSVFWYGWLTQFTLALIGFHWIPYTIVEFGHMPYAIGALGLIAFAAFSNLHIPLAACLWFFLKKNNRIQKNSFFTLAVLTAILEKINPQIFPWHMGYTWMYGELPAYHIADLIGFSGLSTITYVLNAWILICILDIQNKKLFKSHVLKLTSFFIFINLLGYYQASKWQEFDSQIKILAVQPNIGNQEKQFEIYGSRFKDQVVQKHIQLTEQQLKNGSVDLIVWPETSIPHYLDPYFYNVRNVQEIRNFIKQIKTPLLAGAYSHNLRTFQDSNSLFLWDENANELGVYKKHILLAFGEYLPFSQYFPSLLKLIPTIANFERGSGPHTLKLKDDFIIGPQICYEGLHPWFTNSLAVQNAHLIINVTNDSWFGHTFEPSQHMFMTLARSIEVRRPTLRVTNTGITTAMLANGKIINISPQKKEWAYIYELDYLKNPKQTLFAIFPYLDFLFCFGWIVFLGLKSKSLFKKLFKW